MNSDFSPSPREELEARITALLLGELPANEAEMLRRRIAEEPDLVRLHEQLKQTIGLVREAAASPQQEVVPAEAPKLSNERREKLLEAFKITRPKEFKPKMSRAKRREWAALAAMLIGLLAVAGLIGFRKLDLQIHFTETLGEPAGPESELSPPASRQMVTPLAGRPPMGEAVDGRAYVIQEQNFNPAAEPTAAPSAPANAVVSSTVSAAPKEAPPANPAKGVA